MSILRQHEALWAPWAYLDGQWQANVLLRWDQHGTLKDVLPDASQQDIDAAGSVHTAQGAVLPGMPNLHSHAFQSAMAGLTEFRGQGQDSFWSWRDLMYRFAARLEPEHMQAIAQWLYIQMLKAGYTSVCEFHYLHHQRAGLHSRDGCCARTPAGTATAWGCSKSAVDPDAAPCCRNRCIGTARAAW